MEPKQLIVAVEGTAAIGPFWQTIVSDYLDKIIRCLCGNDATSQNSSATHVDLSLVMFNAHGSYSGCLVQRSGWTRDMNVFFQWLSSLPFTGGGFNDAAIAEGLAEALMMFSSPNGNQKILEGQRHCILVAASNPYPLPTLVYQPELQNPGKSNVETQPDNRLSDAETLAKSFAHCAISLSIICPKQLPKLRGIYNAGKRNPHATDPHVDDVKNPHFLVLISENFVEACSILSPPGITSSPSNQNPIKADAALAPSVSLAHSVPPTNGSILIRSAISVGNTHPATVKVEPAGVTSVTRPIYSHIPSVPRAVVQNSSPLSTSQDMPMIPNNENIPDRKPQVSNVITPLQPVRQEENVRILNEVAQHPPVGVTSIPGSLPVSVTGQVALNSSGAATPGIPQQRQGLQSVGVNSNNSVQHSTLNQEPQAVQSKYVKVWEGNLSGQRQGQPVFITKLEGYRSATASETLAANWPETMQIGRLIARDHMNNKHYVGKADFLVFRAMNVHGFLGQLQEKKLCAVIQLPSQTLLLSVSDKAHRLIGMLFPGDMVVFKPQISNQQQLPAQMQQQQNLQQVAQSQQPATLQQMSQRQIPSSLQQKTQQR